MSEPPPQVPPQRPTPGPDGEADRVRLDPDDPIAAEARAERRQRRAARNRRVRRRRLVAGLAVLGLLGLVVLVIGGLWYEHEVHASGPPGTGLAVRVAPGEATGTVVGRLAADGVVDSPLAFRLYEVVHGTPSVVPGLYWFHHHETFASVHAQLAGGPDAFSVSIPSGFTLAEIAQKLGDASGGFTSIPVDEPSFTRAVASGSVRSPYARAGSTNLEGLVADGMYTVVPGETSTQLLAQMVRRFDAQADAAGLPAAAGTLGYSRYQLVTMASIVEKEGYVPANMGQVARVILNRLAAGTPLQMDSTVLYALHQDGGPVTPADEQVQSPYNTYLNTGLTPTPICVPSVAALEATAHPTPGPWLYFEVVSKSGTEAFSSTYAGQLAAEQLAASRGLG